MHTFANGPLSRYEKLRVAHEPGMTGTFSPPPRLSDPDMHHGTRVTHMSWSMPGSLTNVFIRIWWFGNRSQYSLRMRNPQFYVSGKRPIVAKGKQPMISISFRYYFTVFGTTMTQPWRARVNVARKLPHWSVFFLIIGTTLLAIPPVPEIYTWRLCVNQSQELFNSWLYDHKQIKFKTKQCGAHHTEYIE